MDEMRFFFLQRRIVTISAGSWRTGAVKTGLDIGRHSTLLEGKYTFHNVAFLVLFQHLKMFPNYREHCRLLEIL